jgi:hypothetical protein
VFSSAGPGRPRFVADLVHLAHDLDHILVTVTHAVHDFLGRHGDFGGVDAVRTEYRTAAALGTLVVVAEPVVEHVLGHVACTDQLGEQLAGQGVIAAIHRAHQILARHRHVLRIAGADEVVALVGAGAAMHAGVHVHAQRAVLAKQFPHLGDGLLLPAIDQGARKAKRFVVRGGGDVGIRLDHRIRLQGRDGREGTIGRCLDLGLGLRGRLGRRCGGLGRRGARNRCGFVSHGQLLVSSFAAQGARWRVSRGLST